MPEPVDLPVATYQRHDMFGAYVEVAHCALPDEYVVLEEFWNDDYTERHIFSVRPYVAQR